MNAIPPSTSLPRQDVKQAPQTPVAVAVASYPKPAFYELAPGTSFEGLVLTRRGRHTTIVRTNFGILELRTPSRFTAGTVLTLVVKAVAPEAQVLISAIERPSRDPAAAAQFGAVRSPDHVPMAVRSNSPTTLRGVHGLDIGDRVTAYLVRPGSWTSAPAPLPPSSIGLSPPGTGEPAVSFGIGHLALHIINVQPGRVDMRSDQSPSFQVAVPSPGGILRATSVGATAIGQPVLRTVGGFLILSEIAEIPQGAVLSLKVIAVSTTPTVTGTGVSSSVPSTPFSATNDPLTHGWPALVETVEALYEANPLQARQLLQTSLPLPDSRLLTTILHFLRSLQEGDVRVWIGAKAARGVEYIAPDLAARLADDFRQMSRATDHVGSKDWRLTQVPFFNGTEFEFLRLLVRCYDRQSDLKPERRQVRRFVVDVALGGIGRLQLDGLVGDVGGRFDLIIRSDSPLPPHMHKHIRSLFANTNAMTGLTGSIGFRTHPPCFIDIVSEPVVRPLSGFVV